MFVVRHHLQNSVSGGCFNLTIFLKLKYILQGWLRIYAVTSSGVLDRLFSEDVKLIGEKVLKKCALISRRSRAIEIIRQAAKNAPLRGLCGLVGWLVFDILAVWYFDNIYAYDIMRCAILRFNFVLIIYDI